MAAKKKKQQDYKEVIYNSILQMGYNKYLLEKIASKTISLNSLNKSNEDHLYENVNDHFGNDANVDQLMKVIRTINASMFELAKINALEIDDFELQDSPPLYISNL